MPSLIRHLLLCTTLLLPLAAFGAKEPAAKIIDTENQEQFSEQIASIRKEMSPGGRFEFVTSDERASVNAQLEEIAAILSRNAAAGKALNDDDKLSVYAAQENANAILTKRDGRRLICEYSAPTGSNRKVKQCATYADRERAHKETQRMMSDNLRKSPSERGI